ncbi:hypothetical protein C0J52_16457 [Blattella germanica]|nr:hypothetical protein C0J52_16457 [Blattella germanica]
MLCIAFSCANIPTKFGAFFERRRKKLQALNTHRAGIFRFARAAGSFTIKEMRRMMAEAVAVFLSSSDQAGASDRP